MPSTTLQALLGHDKLEMINTYVRLAEQGRMLLYAEYSSVGRSQMHHSSKGKREGYESGAMRGRRLVNDAQRYMFTHASNCQYW